MTPSSVRLRRVSGVLLIALLAPLAAFAQAGGTRTAPAQAAPSQSAPARATPAQSGPSQAAPSQAASSQATPSPATSAQGSSSQAPPTGAPASAAAPAGQAATAAPPGSTTPPTDSGPAYDIEIVIFRTQAALGQPEDWATETTASATIAGGEAASGSGVGKLLTVLPSSDYRLTAIATRLRTSGTYVPVAHAAWVQTASAWGTHAGFPLESLGVSVPGLTGVISLERGQYLHLGMTLNYTMQDPPAGLNAPPGTTFVMNETRRVRFYQRNYYDHPAFGVIALVTPARGRRAPGR